MLRIVFAATPELACPSLEALQQASAAGQIEIAGILTQPDRPAGRKRQLKPSPIKVRALELGLEPRSILCAQKLDAELQSKLAAMHPDLLAVFAYGKILPQVLLNLFPLGGINLHPSALPQWRGPSPIEAQLLSGAEQLAISVQRISLQMDAGDILRQEFYPLPDEANYFVAAQIAAAQGAALLRQTCEQIAAKGQNYLNSATAQKHSEASYCPKIRKEDGRLNWQSSALQLGRQCRAYAAWPKAHSWLRWPNENSPRQVNILQAAVWAGQSSALESFIQHNQARPGQLLTLHPEDGLLVLTGQGILAIRQLQRQGKKSCNAKDFANQLNLPKWRQIEQNNGRCSAYKHLFCFCDIDPVAQ